MQICPSTRRDSRGRARKRRRKTRFLGEEPERVSADLSLTVRGREEKEEGRVEEQRRGRRRQLKEKEEANEARERIEVRRLREI